MEYIGVAVQNEKDKHLSLHTMLKSGATSLAEDLKALGCKVWFYENGEWSDA